MKKQTIIFLSLFALGIGLAAWKFAGKSPAASASPAKDSLVYVQDKIDTAKLESMVYRGPDHRVLYTSPGYLIVKIKAASKDGKKWQAVSQPEVLGGLDSALHPVEIIRN